MNGQSPERAPLPSRSTRKGSNAPGKASRKADTASRNVSRGELQQAPERLQAELERRRSKRKRIALITGLSILAVLVVVVVLGFLYLGTLQDQINRTIGGERLDLDLVAPEPMEPYTLLIMGFDVEDGVSRSDTIILTRIDPRAGKVWMISIPRDLRVDLPGYGYNKINAAYVYGGEQMAVDTVEELTGVDINHYMGIEMEGFMAIVDAMGGAEIDIPMQIIDPDGTYPTLEPGLQTLSGEMALHFVRIRKAFADSDYTRMRNQQVFFKSLANQVAGMSATQIPGVVKSATPYLSTDMSLTELVRTARDLRDIGAANVYTDTLPTEIIPGYLVIEPRGFEELMRRFNAGEVIGAEAIAAEEAARLAETEGHITPAEVSVVIRNGSSRGGIAAAASSVLQPFGFVIAEVGNVQNPGSYPKTYIIYKNSLTRAELVAKHLQPGIEIRPSDGAYSFEGDVLLVLGDDWDQTRIPVRTE